MRVLVTGAAGFIGGNLMSQLHKQSIEAIGIDAFSEYYSTDMKRSRLKNLKFTKECIEVDVCDTQSLKELFYSFMPTHVVHLAGQGGVRASAIDPYPYIYLNQLGFMNALSLSEEFEVEKFIYASSSSVYGDNAHIPFTESQELGSPKSLYALSKISNELIARNLPLRKTQRIGVRFFTVYGPWNRPDMLVFRILAKAVLGDELELTTNLDYKRDFTFVDDVSRVLIEMINQKSFVNESKIFNIAGSAPHTFRELFKIIEEIGVDFKIIKKEISDFDVRQTHASVEELQNNHFTIPNTNLEVGVEKTWEWILSQDTQDLKNWLN